MSHLLLVAERPQCALWQNWRRLDRDIWVSGCRPSRPPAQVEVAVRGELDAFTAPAMQRMLDELLSAGVVRLVLDFAGVEFVGVAGARELAYGAFAREFDGGWLRIRNAAPTVERAFEIIGLGRLALLL